MASTVKPVDYTEDKPLLEDDVELSGFAKFLDCLKPPPCPWPAGHFGRLFILLAVVALLALAIIFHSFLGYVFGAHMCNNSNFSCKHIGGGYGDKNYQCQPTDKKAEKKFGTCESPKGLEEYALDLDDLFGANKNKTITCEKHGSGGHGHNCCQCLDGPLAVFINMVGWWGPVIYAGVYILCTIAFIPGSVLTLAAGVVFANFGTSKWIGLAVAFGTISVGSTVGAMLAFLLGRYLLSDWVQKKIEPFPIFKAIDHAISDKGLTMVFLLRLSPALPFNLLNYALGLTTVGFISYSISSWIGMMPGTFLYVYIGWAAVTAATSTTSGTTAIVKDILIYGVGGAATITAVVIVTILARKQVQKAMKEMELDVSEHEPARKESSINHA